MRISRPVRLMMPIVVGLCAAAFLLVGGSGVAGASNSSHGKGERSGFSLPADASGQNGCNYGCGGNLQLKGGCCPIVDFPPQVLYAIYWFPQGSRNVGTPSSNYTQVTDQFLRNVAADSNKTSNPFWSSTQYSANGLSASDQFTFGGSTIISDSLGGLDFCQSSIEPRCITSDQVIAKIATVAAAFGWQGGNHTFLVFFAPGMGSADNPAGGTCGYHSFFNDLNGVSFEDPYAVINYTANTKCDLGSKQQPRPNRNDADVAINTASHEMAEIQTNIFTVNGNGWRDRNGNENGDKCNYTFGNNLATKRAAGYDVTIGTGQYQVQGEWSNASKKCVMTGY